jgi:hypothetical protein
VALVYSTIWLLVGLVGLVWLGLIMPALLKVPPAQGGTQLPAAARMAIVVVSLAVGAVFYVALPAVIVFFYSRPSVRANFECFDPGPAWTDACPLPVLGFSAFMFLAALGTLGTAVTGTAFCFGQVVGGLPAVALTLASSGLAGVLAWGLFRMRPAAWWGTLGWVLFWFSSWISSVALLTAEEFYAAMRSGRPDAGRQLGGTALADRGHRGRRGRLPAVAPAVLRGAHGRRPTRGLSVLAGSGGNRLEFRGRRGS